MRRAGPGVVFKAEWKSRVSGPLKAGSLIILDIFPTDARSGYDQPSFLVAARTRRRSGKLVFLTIDVDQADDVFLRLFIEPAAAVA
jgi:hypothetical protein